MKKATAFITLALMLMALLGACKKTEVTPTVSPNVPVVSESPAIASPKVSSTPKASAAASPSASVAASPAASSAASPKASK